MQRLSEVSGDAAVVRGQRGCSGCQRSALLLVSEDSVASAVLSLTLTLSHSLSLSLSRSLSLSLSCSLA
jgi:hypothetical protein